MCDGFGELVGWIGEACCLSWEIGELVDEITSGETNFGPDRL